MIRRDYTDAELDAIIGAIVMIGVVICCACIVVLAIYHLIIC